MHKSTIFKKILLTPNFWTVVHFPMNCTVSMQYTSMQTRVHLSLWKLTVWKQRLKWNSHCIMSKKMGMVALRSSISGTSVISRIGPTISGINLILCGPAGCWEETSQHAWILQFICLRSFLCVLCSTHRICLWYFCRQVQQHREYQLSATSSQCLFVSNNNLCILVSCVQLLFQRHDFQSSPKTDFHLCSANLQSLVQSQHWIQPNISESLVPVTKPAIKRCQLMNNQTWLRNTSSVRWQKILQRGTWEPKILSQRYFLNCPATN